MESNKTFGQFMTEVLNKADELSFEKWGRPLSDKYEAPSTILKMIGSITTAGWKGFNALSKLLSNVSYFAFATALGAFILSPIGISVVGSLVYWGGKDSLKLLYNNRTLVEAVKKVGDKYKSRFEECTTSEGYDQLVTDAANDLCNL
jgi:hypothetical protein